MKRRDFLKTSVVAGAALSIDFTGLQAASLSNRTSAGTVHRNWLETLIRD